MSKQMPVKINILVYGVGGAGTNSILRMKEVDVEGVKYATIGTSKKKCDNSPHIKLIETHSTLAGCGGDPTIGRELARKKEREISDILDGNEMVIISAGLGRGTGTGASTVVAEIAKEKGILSAGVFTMPFLFEGKRRRITADEGLAHLMSVLDCVVVIRNDALLKTADGGNISLPEAFKMADDTLMKAVRGISEIIYVAGQINIDFADLRTTITQAGKAVIGMGEAEGQNRAVEAFEGAVNSPLIDVDLKGARRILLNIVSGDLLACELHTIGNMLEESIANDEANIIVGTVEDPKYNGKIKVTLFATDFVKTDLPDKKHVFSVK